ncbi:MAG TPA: Xaa-Pro dipeptidase [Firmicutes bacterium]|nr:Xaa-Pro dipeptidase [Bacillota bacterium]
MLARVKRVIEAMPQVVDGLIVLQPENRRWVSGFTGSSGVVVVGRQGQPVFLTDFRYTQQAGKQCQGYEIVRHGQQLTVDIKAVLERLAIKKLGFEKDYITVGQHTKWTSEMEGIELIPLEDILLDLRAVKDPEELELLAQAAAIADKAFTHILGFLRPGLSERRVALELERHMQDLGASGPSFDTIVASGVRSSMPHGVASDKLLEENDFITMDFGCVYKGYCSDMTRTVVLGKASPRQREVYEIVLEAQLAGVEGIRAGITGKEADSVARDIIAAKGYGEQFGHGLGHGVGLAIHESPRAGATSEDILAVNNLVTVEPGIYLPDWGGVRIEDTVVVQEGGCRNLMASAKELIEIK